MLATLRNFNRIVRISFLSIQGKHDGGPRRARLERDSLVIVSQFRHGNFFKLDVDVGDVRVDRPNADGHCT